MDDEARATVGLDLDPDQASRKRPWDGRRSPYGFADRGPSDSHGRNRWGCPGAGDLCRARPRHQQLPAAGRARRPATAFRVVDAFSRIVRLGEGVIDVRPAERGRRSARAIEALKVCRDKMRNRDVTRARLIATEACRAAVNGARLPRCGAARRPASDARDRRPRNRGAAGRDRLHAAGRSARPTASSCSTSAAARRTGAARPRPAVPPGPPAPEIRGWDSLPVGVVTLAERHGGHTVTREIFEAMVAEVAGLSSAFAAAQPAVRAETLASARHLGHGHHDCGRASRSARATTAAVSTAAG